MLVENTADKPRVAIDQKALLSLGRPMWGAMLQEERTGVRWPLSLVEEKFWSAEENVSKLLALLSYRMDLSVPSQSLAEELTRDYFRY